MMWTDGLDDRDIASLLRQYIEDAKVTREGSDGELPCTYDVVDDTPGDHGRRNRGNVLEGGSPVK